MLNEWKVTGRLTRDPWVADSEKVMKISIAVSKGYTQEKIKKAQEQGNTLKTADFFEVTIFNSKKENGSDSGLFNWARTFKKGDEVTLELRPENTEPQKRTNKEGIPEIYYKDLYVVTKIHQVHRYNGGTAVTVDEAENEPDPIEVQAKMTTPSQGGNTPPPSDW